MEPYWQSKCERWTIYNGDCLDMLPTMEAGSVDAVVTSPPYNLNKIASGGGSSKMSYAGWYPDEMPERTYQARQVQVLDACSRVCRGSIFYNHRIRYAWHGRNLHRPLTRIYHPMDWLRDFPIWCEIIWHRGSTTGHANGRCRLADERIYQIGKPVVWNDDGLTTVWKISPDANDGHPCSFPIDLPLRCIQAATNEGSTVLDPFAGSCTTGVACVRTGRRFIGIEIEARYCEIAAHRIETEIDRSQRP